MAKFANCNSVPVAHAYAIVLLKTTLKLAGWTVPSSSDAITYNSTGDQITTGATGAGGFGNAGSWFRIQEPGGRREWCFQASSAQFRAKWSESSKFTGGTPGTTRVPSAVDEQVLLGGGTDAAPTYANLLTGATYRVHIVANSTAIGGVYPFVLWCTTTPGSTAAGGFIAQEPMSPGSYDAGDLSPLLVMCSVSAGIPGGSAWFGYGGGSPVFGPVTISSAGVFNGAMPTDYSTSKDVNGRPYWTRTTGGHWKGYGTTMSFKGPARSYPATANTATDGQAYIGSYVLPFADNLAPGV